MTRPRVSLPRPKTRRKLPPVTRAQAKLLSEATSALRRLTTTLAKVEALENEVALLKAEKDHLHELLDKERAISLSFARVSEARQQQLNERKADCCMLE